MLAWLRSCLALADAAALLGAIAKLRQIDLRQRDRDVLAPLATDHLALRHILAQIFFDFSSHDLPEAIQIALDASNGHSCLGGWELGDGGMGNGHATLTPIPHPLTPNSWCRR